MSGMRSQATSAGYVAIVSSKHISIHLPLHLGISLVAKHRQSEWVAEPISTPPQPFPFHSSYFGTLSTSSPIMRPIHGHPSALLSAAFILPSLALAIGQNCEFIVADGAKFNLKPLGGVHSVSSISPLPPGKLNSTFSLNICAPLKKPKNPVLKGDTCDGGTYGMNYAC